MGGLSETCVAKTNFEVRCRHVEVMSLEKAGGLY